MIRLIIIAMNKRRIGIFGDTGMVGSTIDSYLGHHDEVSVVFRKNSKRTAGEIKDCELCFLATNDTESMKYAVEALDAGVRIIDMSGAFRLPQKDFEKWYGVSHAAPDLIGKAVYGMPALNAGLIEDAVLVANPGCYATSAILALKPLKGMIEGEAVIVATSGNSGARREVESESDEITYSYGKKHKHVPEITQYAEISVDFTPIVLRSVFRGINSNIRVKLSDFLCSKPTEEAAAILENMITSAYHPDDLVFVRRDSPEKTWGTRDVNGTNEMIIKVRVDSGFVYICSMLDNLVKGAAGQAVENMNIMLGLPRLKSIKENETL